MPNDDEVAGYLSEVLPELSALAERAGFDVAAYFLQMARLDVEQQLERKSDEQQEYS